MACWAAITPRALALRISRSSVSPSAFSCGGLVADQVVEGGQVEGVAGDVEVGGAVVVAGGGVPQGDVPTLPALLLLLLEELGVVLGDRHRDRGLDRGEPAGGAAWGRAGRPRTPRRPWTTRGWPGRPGGPSTAPPPGASTSRQIFGRRCWRSRASAISFIPVSVDTPRAAATGSGANAETAGVPAPPRDSSWCSTPGRASPAQVATPVSAVAGCSTHHWPASRSLPRSSARAPSLRCSSTARRPSASRSSTTTGCPIASTSNIRSFSQRAPLVSRGVNGSWPINFREIFDRRTKRDREPPAGVSTRSLGRAAGARHSTSEGAPRPAGGSPQAGSGPQPAAYPSP